MILFPINLQLLSNCMISNNKVSLKSRRYLPHASFFHVLAHMIGLHVPCCIYFSYMCYTSLYVNTIIHPLKSGFNLAYNFIVSGNLFLKLNWTKLMMLNIMTSTTEALIGSYTTLLRIVLIFACTKYIPFDIKCSHQQWKCCCVCSWLSGQANGGRNTCWIRNESFRWYYRRHYW